MLLEKTRANEYSSQSHVLLKNNRISLTTNRSKCKHKSKERPSSRESSLLSVSSSAKSSKGSSLKSKNKSQGSTINGSKQRLSKKIEELKAKALLH